MELLWKLHVYKRVGQRRSLGGLHIDQKTLPDPVTLSRLPKKQKPEPFPFARYLRKDLEDCVISVV